MKKVFGVLGFIGGTITGMLFAQRSGKELRRKRDWEGQLACCLDPAAARKVREEGRPADADVCSMCGEYCVFKLADEAKD